VIADNLSTHKTQAVRTFLLDHPHVQLHFTPTYSSWLNQIELWFSKIERDLLARGIFTSVGDLLARSADTSGTTTQPQSRSAGRTETRRIELVVLQRVRSTSQTSSNVTLRRSAVAGSLPPAYRWLLSKWSQKPCGGMKPFVSEANCCEMWSSSGSDQYRPMSWTPMGSPSFDVPSGMTSAGWPLALNGAT
jgi:hypothetical protein